VLEDGHVLAYAVKPTQGMMRRPFFFVAIEGTDLLSTGASINGGPKAMAKTEVGLVADGASKAAPDFVHDSVAYIIAQNDGKRQAQWAAGWKSARIGDRVERASAMLLRGRMSSSRLAWVCAVLLLTAASHGLLRRSTHDDCRNALNDCRSLLDDHYRASNSRHAGPGDRRQELYREWSPAEIIPEADKQTMSDAIASHGLHMLFPSAAPLTGIVEPVSAQFHLYRTPATGLVDLWVRVEPPDHGFDLTLQSCTDYEWTAGGASTRSRVPPMSRCAPTRTELPGDRPVAAHDLLAGRRAALRRRLPRPLGGTRRAAGHRVAQFVAHAAVIARRRRRLGGPSRKPLKPEACASRRRSAPACRCRRGLPWSPGRSDAVDVLVGERSTSSTRHDSEPITSSPL